MSRRSRAAKGKANLRNVKLRVMADYGTSGIWVMEQHGVFRHAMVSHEWLGLPPELAQRFQHWIEKYEANYDQSIFDEEHPEWKGYIFEVESFNAEGRELAHALKAYAGSECYVEFQPESKEGNGLGQSEVIAETVSE